MMTSRRNARHLLLQVISKTMQGFFKGNLLRMGDSVTSFVASNNTTQNATVFNVTTGAPSTASEKQMRRMSQPTLSLPPEVDLGVSSTSPMRRPMVWYWDSIKRMQSPTKSRLFPRCCNCLILKVAWSVWMPWDVKRVLHKPS